MNKQLFRVMTFPIEDSKMCACIITGYRGRIAAYKNVIKILNERGYSVIAYEHTHTVFTQGKPDLLPELVTQICDDFAGQSANFEEVICVGASIGAGLCFAIQSKIPKVKFGIYAGAGVSPPDTIYTAPLFYFVRRKFMHLGINQAELKKVWAELDILPAKRLGEMPFMMVLGKKDKIVKYDEALATLHAWQSLGEPIRIITKADMGHLGIIRWYKNNFNELLTDAEGQKF